MATLTTVATIRAHDALTGPLNAMASKVNAISGRFAGGARRMGAAGQSLGIGMAGGVYGFSALLDKAEQFNKNIFGIGAASLNSVDGNSKGVDGALKDMARMEQTSMRLSRELGMSVTAISGIEETLAKAGMDGSKLDEVARAAATLSKTDLETPANSMADFLHTLTVIQKPKQGQGFGSFIKEQADMVFAAASETKLSVGSIMEGMKQFQTIGSGMGLKTEDMLAMLMAGAQRGFGATEFGTALKSDLIRLIKPTAEGQAALSRLGINKTDKMFTADAAVALDPTRALSNLNRSVGGGLEGNIGKSIKAQLFEAQQNDVTHTDAFLSKLTAYIAGKKGIKNLEDVQALRQSIESSVLTTNGSLNAPKLLAEMVRKGATDADLASVFEGRQLARNKALIEAIRTGEYDQNVQMLKRQNGQGLDSIETLWSKSSLGNVKAMQAAWERFTISLANAEGLQRFVNFAERGAEALNQINPKMLDLALRATALGMVAGPLLNLGRGLFAIGGAAMMAARGFGGLLALPFARFAGLAAGASASMAGMALKAVMLGTGFKALQTGSKAVGILGSIAGAVAKVARFAGPFALVAGAFELFQNWESVSGWFDQLANSPSIENLGSAFSRLMSALSPLGAALSSMVDSLVSFLGFDPKESSLIKGIEWMVDKFAALINIITRAVSAFNEWTGLTSTGSTSQGGQATKTQGWFSGLSGGPIGSQTGRLIGDGKGRGKWVPNDVYGPPQPLDLTPINNAGGALDNAGGSLQGSAQALQGAATAIQSAAERLQAPVVVPSGASSPREKAQAPTPRVTNGQQYNGGN